MAEKLRVLGILKELGGDVQVGKKLSTKLLTPLQDEGTINTFLQLCAIDTTSDNDTLFDKGKDLLDEQISLVARTVEECYCKFPLEKIIPPEYGMKISLMHDTPIFSRPRRLSYAERNQVREIVKNLLEKNIIRPSNSPYASPLVLVRKNNGEIRKCVDYSHP